LNDNNWDVDIDGGALRLYPHTQEYRTPEEAVDASNVKEELYTDDGVPSFVDISPINGRLLIFDSRLVHSVNEVLSSTKVRRALTLWINKPNDSGVSGEKFY
jgi:Rps23 Pro-64 3,4-dihydroxylase Tpa1-like proline 4-hydroxylase